MHDFNARYLAWRKIRSSEPSLKRPFCDACDRPASVCVCASLPAAPLCARTPVIVLQHRREAKRALNSGSLLNICMHAASIETVAARSLAPLWQNQRLAALQARVGPVTLLVLYPGERAIDLAAARARIERGERFGLVVIDGTWQEAREIFSAAHDACGHIEYLALKPADLAALDQGAPSFAGCRKPEGPDCLCTLEAVALALRGLEPSPERGAALATALLRPLSHMVAHQTTRTAGREVHRTERPRYVPGLSERAAAAAAHAAALLRPCEIAAN